MEQDERRQCLRVSTQGAFQFRKFGDNEVSRGILNGKLLDYSIAGIRFVTSERLEKNSSLLIELDIENLQEDSEDWKTIWQIEENEVFNVIGSVMWCQGHDNGSGDFEIGTRFIEKG